MGLRNSRFVEVGFHGDIYLLKVVDVLASKANLFIETGSNVGSTLSYFAKRFADIECLSCEPDESAYSEAVKNTKAKNVQVFKGSSQDFIAELKKKTPGEVTTPTVFWLDAHGYGFEWPLIEEMNYILRNYKTFFILVDDFKVPGIPEFGYDVYQEQHCSHEYLAPHLLNREFYLYYPTYKEKTSQHHPLRGWGLYSSERISWTDYGIDFVREEFHQKKH